MPRMQLQRQFVWQTPDTMNKVLAFLWIIIIGGTVFISIHFFKLDTQTSEPQTIPKVETINEIVVEEKPALNTKDTNTYMVIPAILDWFILFQKIMTAWLMMLFLRRFMNF